VRRRKGGQDGFILDRRFGNAKNRHGQLAGRSAAQYLAERQVRLIGVDYLSVGGFRADGVETQQALLKAHIWIIEGLNLKRVRPGRAELVCLPLKIAGGDGVPVRAPPFEAFRSFVNSLLLMSQLRQK